MSLPPKRLKRLIRQRDLLERLQRRELAEAIRLRDRRAHALGEAHASRDQLLQPAAPGRPVDIADLLAGAAYLRRLNRDIAARQAALHHSEEDVAEERALLLERRRDRRALELLLERRQAEERLRLARATARQLDDLVAARWRTATPPREDAP
jgi:flagellar export protein FliJ